MSFPFLVQEDLSRQQFSKRLDWDHRVRSNLFISIIIIVIIVIIITSNWFAIGLVHFFYKFCMISRQQFSKKT